MERNELLLEILRIFHKHLWMLRTGAGFLKLCVVLGVWWSVNMFRIPQYAEEEEDGENRQMQNVFLSKQTQKTSDGELPFAYHYWII